MFRHSYVKSPIGFEVVVENTEEGGRHLRNVLSLTPKDFGADHSELVRLLCFLLDALAVRDAEALDPADWVEIGSDDEDEPDLYAEAWEDGYLKGVSDAFETVGNELGPDYDEYEGEPKSYEQGFRDGSAAALKLVAEDDCGSEVDEDDEVDLCRAKRFEVAFNAGFDAAVRQLEMSAEDEDELSDDDYHSPNY